MRAFLQRQQPVIVTAVVVGTLVAFGPSVAQAAYDAVNSDKVDGRHAVGAGASTTNRAGKLVATNTSGLLPNNIIAKAPDAGKLGGSPHRVTCSTSTAASVATTCRTTSAGRPFSAW